MTNQFSLDPSILEWLLEEDHINPSIRFLSLMKLCDKEATDREVQQAKADVMLSGPVPEILANQHLEGYWMEPGAGYRPKYKSTVWSLIMLAQLGAEENDPRIKLACEYILSHTRAKQDCFSIYATQTGAVHCLQGNLAAALMQLGVRSDPRLDHAIDWMARSVTGERFGSTEEKHIEPHYIRSGISGSGFLCSTNDHQPCAWGAVKVGWALSMIPENKRTPQVKQAIQACIDFLISVDPATAEYPHPWAKKPSTSWFKFGFPVFYVTDLMQNISVLLSLGLEGDKRLSNAIQLIENECDDDGKWKMTYTYNGKTWVDIEEKGKPSKWVTYRAFSVLKRYYRL